jgi:DNA-directed RNA polymerase subunit L
MEVKVVRETDTELEFEIIGEKSILNPLKHKLLERKNVTYAEWRVTHPLTANPRFYVTVNAGSPRQTAKEAIDEIIGNLDALLGDIEDAA